MTFHFHSDYTWAQSSIPGLQSMIVLESREFLNSLSLDENMTALVIDPDELLWGAKNFYAFKGSTICGNR